MFNARPAGLGNKAPVAAPAAPKQNGLAAFANSDMGREWAAANQQYGPTAMPNYTDAFQGALDAARGNIGQQLQGALGDIQNSQAHAQAALGQYAPMVNNAYQAGLGQIGNAAAGGASALAKYGVGTQVANANLAPERIAMNTTHSGDLADQALLGEGMQQQAEHERALAQLAAQDRYGQLDQQQAQLQSQAQLAAQQQQYAQQNSLQQFGLNMLNNAQQFQQQKSLAATNATQNTNPATGIYAAAGLTEGQVLSAQKLPQYKRFNAMITGYKPGTPQANTAAGMIMQATSGNPALQQVLMAENPEFFSTALPVNEQNTGATGGTPGWIQAVGPLTPINAIASGQFGRGAKRVGSWLNPFG